MLQYCLVTFVTTFLAIWVIGVGSRRHVGTGLPKVLMESLLQGAMAGLESLLVQPCPQVAGSNGSVYVHMVSRRLLLLVEPSEVAQGITSGHRGWAGAVKSRDITDLVSNAGQELLLKPIKL